MKAVVFAYHEIGYACLDELLSFGADVPCLFTHVDDPGEEIWFKTPVLLAKERGIPVYTPETLKDPHWTDLIRDANPDIIFSFITETSSPKESLKFPGRALLTFTGHCCLNSGEGAR